MDAETAANKAAEAALKRSFYPPHTTAVSTINEQLADAARDLALDIKKRERRIEEEREKARITEASRNAEAEAARIAEARAIEQQTANAAEAARIAAKIKAEEDEKTKKWWDGRTGFTKKGTEFSLGTQGGGRNGKKKSKRMIKMKNAKNKSKSKSQSRRQRQKRRRHSRRV